MSCPDFDASDEVGPGLDDAARWLTEEFRNIQARHDTGEESDARALIRFLVDAVGFEETAVYGDGDRVEHAQLSWTPGGGIMLGSAGDRGPDDQWPLVPGTFGAYVVTDDPDVLFERAKSAGAEIIRELTDTDYGSRDFGILDPEGNRWSFGTYRGEPRKP